jgi:stage V sporulation protein B
MTELSAIEQLKPANSPDIARVAGRGVIYITAAKIWFMVSGYGIHFILPRLVTPEQFGLYQVTISVVSIINAVLITGTHQTVSKYVSQEEEKADSVKSKALKLQLVLGGGIWLSLFLLAPAVSAYLNDPRLADYLRLASLITLAYSFYAVLTGYFNGQRRFFIQAGLDIIYSTLKLCLILLLVWLGYGVAGAIGGFAAASVIILALSAAIAGRGKRRGEVETKDLLRFQISLLLFTLALNLLQKTDLVLVKALSSADAKLASEMAAYYGAAINIANITYQAIFSATSVVFPIVSRATFADDGQAARSSISKAFRYGLMIMALVATLFSANSNEVLGLVYPPDYQASSSALRVVAYGMLFFGLLHILTTIISASGRPTISLMIALVALMMSVALNALLIPRYGLMGAAIATTASTLSGAFAGGAYLLVRFGRFIRPLSAMRIVGCASLIYVISVVTASTPRPLVLGKLILLALIYLLGLVLSRELDQADLAAIKKII